MTSLPPDTSTTPIPVEHSTMYKRVFWRPHSPVSPPPHLFFFGGGEGKRGGVACPQQKRRLVSRSPLAFALSIFFRVVYGRPRAEF